MASAERQAPASSSRRLFLPVVSTLVAILSALFYLSTQLNDSAPFDLSNAAINDRLGDLERLSVSPYRGCESLVLYDGVIYTGAEEGKILKIDSSGVHVFAQLGPAGCVSASDCGRPLGMRLSSDNQSLLVIDAYLGLFSVPLSTGIPRKLFPLNDDFKVTFFNDFDVLPNGTIILSESSTKYSLKQIVHVLFEENPSGRLLSVDPVTGKWHEIIDQLRFANGVQLHSDGKSILVAECGACRVLRVPLDGGQATVFGGQLLGNPDNIRTSPRGGYWVPVSNLKNSLLSKILDLPNHYRWARWLTLKVSDLPWLHSLRYTKSAMLLRLDDNGRVIEAIRDQTNSVPNVAEVHEQDGVIYTSSYFLPYIGRLRIA